MFYLMGFLWINMTFFLNIWYFECLVTQISQFQHSKTGFWATWVLGWWLISASVISILGKILVILHYICWVCFSPVTSFCLKNVLGFSVYLSLIKIPLLLLILQTLNMIINTHLRQGKKIETESVSLLEDSAKCVCIPFCRAWLIYRLAINSFVISCVPSSTFV